MKKKANSKSNDRAPSVLNDNTPDYDAWFRRDAYMAYEIQLLAIGIDPKSDFADLILEANTNGLPRKYSRNVEIQKALKQYQELKDIFDRSERGGKLQRYRYRDYIPQSAALEFIVDTGVFCEAFRVAAKKWADRKLAGHEGTKPKPAASPSPVARERALVTRERATVLKLIAGMAIRGYAYDPKAAKNAAIGDIESDLQLLGVRLDQDTIRKWVQEAVSYVDEAKR